METTRMGYIRVILGANSLRLGLGMLYYCHLRIQEGIPLESIHAASLAGFREFWGSYVIILWFLMVCDERIYNIPLQEKPPKP